MAIEIITKEDLNNFRIDLLKDITEIFKENHEKPKQWIKSAQVRRMLNISPGTLQTLRINKTLSYTKIGGSIYYASEDIHKAMERNSVKSIQTLFNS